MWQHWKRGWLHIDLISLRIVFLDYSCLLQVFESATLRFIFVYRSIMSDTPSFGPCSIKQQLYLLEDEVDVCLTGGGELRLHIKNNSLIR